MAKLLPCPFCGYEVEEDREASLSDPIFNDDYEDGEDGYYQYPSQVVCVDCGAGVVGGLTTEEAIKAWNTRSCDKSPSPRHTEGENVKTKSRLSLPGT